MAHRVIRPQILLHHALLTGDVETIDQLCRRQGPEFVRMDQDPDELTALHHAAAGGLEELAIYLLAPPVNANPRAAHVNQFTPLHAAAMHGHTSICKRLLALGADVNAQTDPQKYAPLHSAAFAGHLDTLRLLLRYRADRSLLNYRGETPAGTAMRTGQLAAVELLDAARHVA
jgi:ankyrin repeat protein